MERGLESIMLVRLCRTSATPVCLARRLVILRDVK
jgi:hypothetical protein